MKDASNCLFQMLTPSVNIKSWNSLLSQLENVFYLSYIVI